MESSGQTRAPTPDLLIIYKESAVGFCVIVQRVDVGFWLRRVLAPHYSHMGCPSVDPAQKVIQRNHILQAERLEKTVLRSNPFAHHG